MIKEITFEQIVYLKTKGFNVSLELPNNKFSEITDYYIKYSPGYNLIFDDDSIITCAEHHRMLDSRGKWVTAKEITEGTELVGCDYKITKTLKIKEISTNSMWVDFSIRDPNEEYLQNNIIHHNSGKSYSIYLIFRYLLARGKKKMMLIVPNTSLVEQMFTDFIDYGWTEINKHVTKLYSGKKPDYSKPILITTWQSIYKQDEEFFKDFDAVVIDEAHNTKSQSIQTVMKKCKKADYRLGFTGTLPTEKADDFNIKSVLGPVIYELKSRELIDRGILSKIYIANLILKYPKEIIDVQNGRIYREEVKFIESYHGRNKAFRFIFDYIPDKHNTLILCGHIDHLEAIHEHLKSILDKKYIIYIIHGKIDAEEREDIRRLMEKGENVVLLATYGTVSTGINIKRIHNVIFASSSKSKIRVLQSIGRGLRTHESKDHVVIWDLIDDMSKVSKLGNVHKNYMVQHWEERQKYFIEQGFISHNLTIEV